MNDQLPAHAQTVVVGGGVVGCSIAYHLARRGHTDVVLLERARLSAGTTWHSAGNMETYRADPLLFEFVRYAVRLFPELERESDQALGWRTTGRVLYTHRPERLAAYRAVPPLAEARGIEVSLLDPRQLEQRFPILDTTAILGGLWVPNDGRVNPTDLTSAFGRAARRRGTRIVEDCPVLRLRTEAGRICGVETGHGAIRCENVVVAAGLWSGEVTSTCGVSLPIHAVEHFYLITTAIAQLPRDLPMFLAFDDYLYGREEVGGLIVGCLDKNAIPVAARDLPGDFAFALLGERWDQFEPYLATALRRFPLLQAAGIRMLLNGPESFTPDGQMIIGPAPGVDRLFVAAGMSSNGIALSAAVGRTLAEWIVDGVPSLDVSRLDIRRFARCQADESFMRRRVTEVPSYCVELHAPGEDYTEARDVRRSPLHEYLRDRAAHYTSCCGWERAAWFGAGTGVPDPRALVNEEIAAAGRDVLAVDGSADALFQIDAPAPGAALMALLGVDRPPPVGHGLRLAITGAGGGVAALVTLCRLGDSRWLLSAPPGQETYLRELVRVRLRGSMVVEVAEVTGQFALVRLLGPGREQQRTRLLALCSSHADAVPIHCWREPVSASDSMLIPAAMASHLAGQMAALAVRWGGYYAEDAWRLLHGIPAFDRELSGCSDVPVADFPCFASLARPEGGCRFRAFIGRVDRDLGLDNGLEPLLSGGEPVGWLTSSAWIPSLQASIVMARVAASQYERQLQVLIGNETVPVLR